MRTSESQAFPIIYILYFLYIPIPLSDEDTCENSVPMSVY